ncbi:DNA polymerase III subunit beta [Rhizobium sp. Root483D2]|uniref:DNA polymerase III subunit beta n=1 Tax=Rhizobium sp. Root483D2 TaxID=1736545 RepID=UPI000712D33D|nr:DNA polymerase III subunit beta [Rhizobium sp. Root483D2]KQY20755.1 hypothetical protein ASD32_04895 [Rhizobium sp. Root483D2]
MFKAEKSALLGALSSVNDAINSRNTIPILANALFEKSGSDLVVTGSNLDIQISATCTAAFADTFQPFTAPYSFFESAVKSMADGPVEIANPDQGTRFDNIVIKAGRAKIKMPTLPARDYTRLKTENLTHALGLDAACLKKSLHAVEFAMSTEETRHYLNGIYMHVHPGGLMFVATDGARLSRRLMPMVEIDEDELPDLPAVIIPKDTVRAITKRLPEEGDVALRLSDERIELTFGNLVIVSKLVDGTFPAYDRITPLNNDKTIRINGKQLDGAIGRVLTVNTLKGSAVKFYFSPDAVRLTSKPGENGEAEDEVEAQADGSVEVGFNGKFLRDVIGALGAGDIEMKLGQPGDAAMIMKPGETESFAILMPMRI